MHSPVDTGRKLNVHIRRSIYVLCLLGRAKTALLDSLITKNAGLKKACNVIKIRLRHKHFLVNATNFKISYF